MKKIRVRIPRISRKAILPFLLGGLLTAAGLEGYRYTTGAGLPTLMQRLQGDSATVAKADSAARVVADASATTDSLPATLAVDTMPVALDSTGTPLAATAAGAVPSFTSTLATDTLAGGDRLPKRRLAKLFGSMQAREAARVLENMSDGEVEVILAQLGDREAASILSNLTPERAAQISQVVISGVRSSP